MALDQSTWTLLFSWVTGRRCFLPEGCAPPATGVVVYVVLLLLVAAAVWKRERIREKLSEF